MTITLPPLPEPEDYVSTRSGAVGTYTAEHMRAHGLEVAQAVIEVCRKACVAQASRWSPSPIRPSSRDIYIVHECAKAIAQLKIEGKNDK